MTTATSLQARRNKAAELQKAHETRSWRTISQDDYFGLIPFGTLERIAKSNGNYFPKKWTALLGVKLPKASTRRPRPLHELPVNTLRYMFEHRVEM